MAFIAWTVVKPASTPAITVIPTKPNNTRRKNFASATTVELIVTPPALTRRLTLGFASLLVACLVTNPGRLTAAAPPAKPLRALIVLGGCCHDYTRQMELLKKGLEARAYVQVEFVFNPDTSTKARYEVYEKPNWAKGYDVIIHDECSADVKELVLSRPSGLENAHNTKNQTGNLEHHGGNGTRDELQ